MLFIRGHGASDPAGSPSSLLSSERGGPPPQPRPSPLSLGGSTRKCSASFTTPSHFPKFYCPIDQSIISEESTDRSIAHNEKQARLIRLTRAWHQRGDAGRVPSSKVALALRPP